MLDFIGDYVDSLRSLWIFSPRFYCWWPNSVLERYSLVIWRERSRRRQASPNRRAKRQEPPTRVRSETLGTKSPLVFHTSIRLHTSSICSKTFLFLLTPYWFAKASALTRGELERACERDVGGPYRARIYHRVGEKQVGLELAKLPERCEFIARR